MEISVLDRSNYFKGLLLLIRKDDKITEPEIKVMQRIGKTLGFDKEFYNSAIKEILNNKYIVDTPSLFSNKEVAIKFIKDGLLLAHSDDDINSAEEEWLKSIAERNNLDLEWFSKEKINVINSKNYNTRLEVEDLVVEYSRSIAT